MFVGLTREQAKLRGFPVSFLKRIWARSLVYPREFYYRLKLMNGDAMGQGSRKYMKGL